MSCMCRPLTVELGGREGIRQEDRCTGSSKMSQKKLAGIEVAVNGRKRIKNKAADSVKHLETPMRMRVRTTEQPSG